MTLNELQEAYPSGIYYELHASFYTLDENNDIGYYGELQDGVFDDVWNRVEYDELEKDIAEDIRSIAAHIRITV